jgi:hypothetical protein
MQRKKIWSALQKKWREEKSREASEIFPEKLDITHKKV